MTKERLVEKTRKLLAKWGVSEDEAERFIADLDEASEDEEEVVEETEIEEATETEEPETEIAPEEEVEEKVEEEKPVEEEETETTEPEETIEEAVEEETAPEVVEEAKEEVAEHAEADAPKWDDVYAKLNAYAGEIATLKGIINELRDRVEGGAFGTTAKLPPADDDEWEGAHTKAYFRR